LSKLKAFTFESFTSLGAQVDTLLLPSSRIIISSAGDEEDRWRRFRLWWVLVFACNKHKRTGFLQV